jgi:hypothetical protein
MRRCERNEVKWVAIMMRKQTRRVQQRGNQIDQIDEIRSDQIAGHSRTMQGRQSTHDRSHSPATESHSGRVWSFSPPASSVEQLRAVGDAW